jgi:hypothetical protein
LPARGTSITWWAQREARSDGRSGGCFRCVLSLCRRHLEHAEVRLDPASGGFTRNEPSGRGELRGWLALPEGENFDPWSLLFAVDAFPPATFDLEFAGWVPTFELTVYVRALPAPGPARVLQRAGMIADRRVDEACYVWDSTGRPVAQGTQLAGVRLG